jgi:hypothetical protein
LHDFCCSFVGKITKKKCRNGKAGTKKKEIRAEGKDIPPRKKGPSMMHKRRLEVSKDELGAVFLEPSTLRNGKKLKRDMEQR